MDVVSNTQFQRTPSRKTSIGAKQKTINYYLKWLLNTELHISQTTSTVIWNQAMLEACAVVFV